MSGKLVITRHGESEYNAKGLWAGWTDVHLTEKGKTDAKKVAELIRDIDFSGIYVSPLVRTTETLDSFNEVLHLTAPVVIAPELRERNYGIFNGKDKWKVKEEVGDEEFQKIRRGYAYQPENGESLEMVVARAVPYYQKQILPRLLAGENILIVGHGNSDRALIKYLENLSEAEITEREMPLGTVLIYTVQDDGRMSTRVELNAEIEATAKA
ncbi:MAG: 2,3-bisphosphoglycerate-dependent phosphoglycerate mutase [Candidatus Nomurabacteria bacterium]|jgi:2,3-bisphosphoglycerate-dependent phosphoglycerate mutase|nr:2,3-bisphosphoglycerate-dependent phosphoglycerate mutase [Candidatus Nomurabacteria bacterium]